MKPAGILLAVVLLGSVGVTAAMAECQIADAKLEEAILNKPDLRGPANTQIVRDLRNLRDAAFTLWSYGRHDDCERLLGNIRELLAGPPMGNLGDNDEEAADKQIAAREPKIQRGAEQGRRGRKKVARNLGSRPRARGLARRDARRFDHSSMSQTASLA